LLVVSICSTGTSNQPGNCQNYGKYYHVLPLSKGN
jgi:hypothetical protein